MKLTRTVRNWVGIVAALSLFFIGCGGGPPTAGEVLESYRAAIGGDAMEGLQSRVAIGKFDLPDMGYSGEVSIKSVPPDLGKLEITIGNTAAASSGGKDGIAWSINPMAGARVLKEGEARRTFREFGFDPVLSWQDSFESAVVQDWDPDAQQVKVLIKSREGDQAICYFDKESGLLARQMTFVDGQRVLSSFEDYREVDGVMMAHQISSNMGGSVNVAYSYEEVEHNVDIPPETFDFPEEIQKLIDG
jgi:hypothetical protein